MFARLGCVMAIALAVGCSERADKKPNKRLPAVKKSPTRAPVQDAACSAVIKALPASKYLGGVAPAVRLVADAERSWTRDCRPAPMDELAAIVSGRLGSARATPVTTGPAVDKARALAILGPAREHDRTAKLARIAEGPRGPMAAVALLLAGDAPATRATEIATAVGSTCLSLVAAGQRRAPIPRVWACGRAAPASTTVPVAVVLVDKERTWVGLSVVKERRQVTDLAGLAEVLAEYKASPHFAGRTDLEIAVKPEAPYSQLVAAIDTAISAGFVDVTALPASALAVRFEP